MNNARKPPKMLASRELAAQLGVDVRDLKRLRDEGRGQDVLLGVLPREVGNTGSG